MSTANSALTDEFVRCVAGGGLAVFPADTVYGLACDPENKLAVERLYLLKGRPRAKAAAIMYFNLDAAMEDLPELGPSTRDVLERLAPGAVTFLLENRAERFPLACAEDTSTLGLRVPDVPDLAPVRRPVLQSSANRAGGEDPRRLNDVPALLRVGADLVIDGGELPGTPSTVVDLRSYEQTGSWSIVRQGAVGESAVRTAVEGQFHFDPRTYPHEIRADIPVFDRLQQELIDASGSGARRILELGIGTGETARRLLARHPDAFLLGVDASDAMLAAARETLAPDRVQLRMARLEEPLPVGRFDLVASALAIHHLKDDDKEQLFARIARALEPGGRFVLADVVVPADPADAVTSLTPDFDRPSPVADQLDWLRAAGLEPRLTFAHRDLAVVVAEKQTV
ncbi:MAG TPA: Sua5/YciO/YrdC/YwlC family protein [Solirubrobacteraceae bacterium]|nr:Sua5/YciO/YrdC/YwlC family protein [Solirubrobacteraceae bacterium]